MRCEKPRYSLILEVMPGDDGGSAPPIVRLRRALKALLRSHGLRCVSAIELDQQGRPLGLQPQQPEVEVLRDADTARP